MFTATTTISTSACACLAKHEPRLQERAPPVAPGAADEPRAPDEDACPPASTDLAARIAELEREVTLERSRARVANYSCSRWMKEYRDATRREHVANYDVDEARARICDLERLLATQEALIKRQARELEEKDSHIRELLLERGEQHDDLAEEGPKRRAPEAVPDTPQRPATACRVKPAARSQAVPAERRLRPRAAVPAAAGPPAFSLRPYDAEVDVAVGYDAAASVDLLQGDVEATPPSQRPPSEWMTTRDVPPPPPPAAEVEPGQVETVLVVAPKGISRIQID